MVTAALVLSSTAFLFSLATVVFSILAYSEVRGMKLSTHKIEFTPVQRTADDPADSAEEILRKFAPQDEYKFKDEEGFEVS